MNQDNEWQKCLWFGLPYKYRENPEPEIMGIFIIFDWIVPVLAWIDGKASGGYGFSFRIYKGSYWKALYNYLFHPEKWGE